MKRWGPFASGAGGWISTAKDLQLFMSALYNGKLVKSSTLQIDVHRPIKRHRKTALTGSMHMD
jgi:CubicO group peptidase (beta-lactamase class C family)